MEESKKNSVHRSSHENATLSVLSTAPAHVSAHAASSPAEEQTVIINASTAETKPVSIWYVADYEHDGQILRGGIYENAAPRFVGTADPGTLITIFDGDKQIGQVVANIEGNWHFTPNPPLEIGPRNLVFSSGISSDSFDYVVLAEGSQIIELKAQAFDRDERSIPLIPGDKIEDTTPRFVGLADPNITITVYDHGKPIATVISDDEGTWYFFPTLGLGEYSLTFDAGNGNTTKPFNFEIIGSAEPEEPVIVEPVDPVIEGPETQLITIEEVNQNTNYVWERIAENGTTIDTTPRFNGKAGANVQITVYDNGQPIGVTTSNARGEWVFTPQLDGGEHNISFKAGEGSESKVFSFTIDANITIEAVNQNTNYVWELITENGTTNDTTPRFNGKSSPNVQITVYDNGKPIGFTTANARGEWVFTPELSGGMHNISFKDAKGNESKVFSFTIDAQITIEEVNQNINYVWESIAENGTTIDTTPRFNGKASPNVLITVYDNGEPIGSTTSNARGEWVFTPELSGGVHNISFKDAQGNGSKVFSFTIDANITIEAVNQDTNYVWERISENGSTNDTTPRFNGKASPNVLITVLDNGQPIGSTTSNARGEWVFTPELGGGEHHISFKDAQGNQSKVFSFTIDAQITIEEVYQSSNYVWERIAENGTTNDTTPRFNGKASPNVLITVYDNGEPIGSMTSNARGEWIYTPELGSGLHNISFKDAQGNASKVFSFTIVLAESQPIIVDEVYDNAHSAWQLVTENGITNDTTPRFNGTSGANLRINVYDNGQPIGFTMSDHNGKWVFTPELKAGAHSFTFKAGEGSESDAFNFTVEVMPITITHAYDDSQGYQRDFERNTTINDSTPRFVGHAEPGKKITVYDNGQPIGIITPDHSGYWSYTALLNSGAHKIVFKSGEDNQTDPFDFTVVTPDSQPITVDDAYDDSLGYSQNFARHATINDTSPSFSGQAGPNAKITVYDHGQPIGTAVSNAWGYWSYTAELKGGAHSITFKAGEGSESEAYDFTVAATPVTIDRAFDDSVGYDREVGDNATVSDTAPHFNGKAAPNTVITVFDNGVPIGSVLSSWGGRWNFEQELGAGKHIITVKSEDGSVSDPFTIYITAPVKAPEVTIDRAFDDSAGYDREVGDNDSVKDTAPRFNGTAKPNTLITIFDNGVPIGSVVSSWGGRWNFEQELGGGEHVITVQGEDGSESDPFTLYIDAPVEPGPDPEPQPVRKTEIDYGFAKVGNKVGHLKQHDVIQDDKPALAGFAEPNSLITIYDNDVIIGVARTSNLGTWSFIVHDYLGQGSHNFVAKADNGQDSDPFVLVVKVPVSANAVYANSGEESSWNSTADTTPDLRGGGPKNVVINLYEGENWIGSVKTLADGSWTFTFTEPLSIGPHHIVAVAEEGNTSETYTFDITEPSVVEPPVEPEVTYTVTRASDDVLEHGHVLANGETDDATPRLYGQATRYAMVQIFDNGNKIGEVRADVSGIWTFEPEIALTLGKHDITAGPDVQHQGPAFSFTVVAPDPENPLPIQIIYEVSNAYDSVLESGRIPQNGESDDAAPRFSGHASRYALVHIFDNGVKIGETRAEASGLWTFKPEPALSLGRHEISAGPDAEHYGPAFVFTVVAPDPENPLPKGTTYEVTSAYDNFFKSGFIKANGESDDNAPFLAGKADSNALVKIFDNGVQIGETRASATGSWTYQVETALTLGKHNITAGSNVKYHGEAFTFTLVPAAAERILVVEGVSTYNEGVERFGIGHSTAIYDNTPSFSGIAAVGSVVTITINGKTHGTALTNEYGRWNFDVTEPLKSGNNLVKVTGEGQVESIDFSFELASPYDIAILCSVYDDQQGEILIGNGQISSDSTPTLKGFAGQDILLEILDNGKPIGSVQTLQDGSWSFIVPELQDGPHSIVVKSLYLESHPNNFNVQSAPAESEASLLNISAADLLSSAEPALFSEDADVQQPAAQPLSIAQADMAVETQSGVVNNAARAMIESEEQNYSVM
ncbi:hypothetical protein HS962_06050 [Pantoea sp. BIGb0393]|uniref:Ig-like domain-containing protein n=1 Tax=Pantoea nemavictus TaxID=2726955 RepID=A0ABU8PQH4_9GAMM|nr:Ig-like domain-containing protein [Pantoea nemavictus]MBA0035792.1 hypothetical protein [Pantoea nemavictus]